jgi:hypothetical protein
MTDVSRLHGRLVVASPHPALFNKGNRQPFGDLFPTLVPMKRAAYCESKAENLETKVFR